MANHIGLTGPVLVWAVSMFLAVQTAMISVPDSGRQTGARLVTPALNARILEREPSGCSSVRFPRGWRNPVLEVSAAGITVKAASVKSADSINAESVNDVLVAMPLTDWPHGRIVVIAGPSLGPGDNEWWKAADRNLARAIEVVKALGALPCLAAS